MITKSKWCPFYVRIETIHYSYKMVGEKPVTHAVWEQNICSQIIGGIMINNSHRNLRETQI